MLLRRESVLLTEKSWDRVQKRTFANNPLASGGSWGRHVPFWEKPKDRAPFSERAGFTHPFVQVKDVKDHEDILDMSKKLPSVHYTTDLVPAYAADPHTYTFLQSLFYLPHDYGYNYHYDYIREVVFPRPPNTQAGELAAGANLVRTTAWTAGSDPAIQQIHQHHPDNFRAVGLAANSPIVEDTTPPGSHDWRDTRLPIGHAPRHPFAYFAGALVFGAYFAGIRGGLAALFWVLRPHNLRICAGAVEADISNLEPGGNLIAKWRQKPIFIRYRTPAQIAKAKADDAVAGSMRHPEKDGDRVVKPEILVMIAVCTHLGCVPALDAGDYGAYFCPCHGSHYDHSGRIRKGPAPLNLEVPPYSFIDEKTIKIGG